MAENSNCSSSKNTEHEQPVQPAAGETAKEKRRREWKAKCQEKKRQQKLLKQNAQENANECAAVNGNKREEAAHKKGKTKLPDRWSLYTTGIGLPLEGTRFVAFKCPLDNRFFQHRPQILRFGIDTVVGHVTKNNFVLGLVIDLTNTDKYYDNKEWAMHQVEYKRVPCPGHYVNTSEHFYRNFAQTVHTFLAENGQNENLIGVHCTHGLNRTGYLICRFLIQEKGWTAQRALESFAASRGYPMERDTYIQSLHEIEKKLIRPNKIIKFADDDDDDNSDKEKED